MSRIGRTLKSPFRGVRRLGDRIPSQYNWEITEPLSQERFYEVLVDSEKVYISVDGETVAGDVAGEKALREFQELEEEVAIDIDTIEATYSREGRFPLGYSYNAQVVDGREIEVEGWYNPFPE
ncbi:MAG: hypothetical protein SVS85_03410 [Candidatus Nanohaloarchaea archaeon]|nr:hypothetical protein [Candidatus Nanohaloarchaea archaeon]